MQSSYLGPNFDVNVKAIHFTCAFSYFFCTNRDAQLIVFHKEKKNIVSCS